MHSEKIKIRTAVKTDAAAILGFIRELADYEKLSHEVVATIADLENTLFGERPAAEVILCIGEKSGPVGFSLFFGNYSTFLGKPGIYLEDLYVQPAHRGKGYGKKLLQAVAGLATKRGCGRLEWSVLDWNTPAIDFYKSVGAFPMSEWTAFRLTGEELRKFGTGNEIG